MPAVVSTGRAGRFRSTSHAVPVPCPMLPHAEAAPVGNRVDITASGSGITELTGLTSVLLGDSEHEHPEAPSVCWVEPAPGVRRSAGRKRQKLAKAATEGGGTEFTTSSCNPDQSCFLEVVNTHHVPAPFAASLPLSMHPMHPQKELKPKLEPGQPTPVGTPAAGVLAGVADQAVEAVTQGLALCHDDAALR